MPSLTINNQRVHFSAGDTILKAAAAAKVTIPTLCHHPDLTPVGSCRLCLVEIASRPGQHPACTLPAESGMVIETDSPALIESRKFILEMLLANYTEPAASNPPHENEFQYWVRHYGVQKPAGTEGFPGLPFDSDPHPLIRVDLNQCILCTRCVRACEEIQGCFVWNVGQRGPETRIEAGLDTAMLEAGCESCGACAAYCPTAALEDRAALGPAADKLVRTTCGYCGVGCQFDLNVRDGRVLRVTSTAEAPVNGHSLCVKGRYGVDFVHHLDRLDRPRIRQYLLDGVPPAQRSDDRGPWVSVDWETALRLTAERLTCIAAESGPDAVAVLASAKCTNEENYLLQKLARQVIGTHNVDHCARLCHASTVAGLTMAFGSGAMSNSMDDVAAQAQAMLVIGSNTTEQHPVFGAMLRQAVVRRGMKLVVADPRKIDLVEFATLHVRQKPGTDVALINGLMHLALAHGWHDEAFIRNRCEGFEELREVLDKYPPVVVHQITGVPSEQLHQAAEILCTHRPMAVVWAMGITQHTTGVMNVLSLANLQMLLGNLGLPGGGVNPLRGQNNVQGACDMGALPNVLPGYQSVIDPEVCRKFANAWRLSPDLSPNLLTTPHPPGLTVTEMITQSAGGSVRGLLILGEDPVMTEPDSNHVRHCLERAELVVLQEIFPSETSAYADILLPGASFAEKQGTFTNTERRIQPIRPAVAPPGEAKPDWQIITELAQRMLALQQRTPVGPQAGWEYHDVPAILAEVTVLTPSYAGVTWERLELGERMQWPVPDSDQPGTPILHADRFPRGKGRFHAVDHLPPAELPDAQFPFLLTTGRVLYHWHGGELSRRTTGLPALCPDPVLEISPADAKALGLDAGDWLVVRSRRGEQQVRAMPTDRVSPGVLFGNFHFAGDQNVNNLTIAALDPIAKIPEYKICAVTIEKRSLDFPTSTPAPLIPPASQDAFEPPFCGTPHGQK